MIKPFAILQQAFMPVSHVFDTHAKTRQGKTLHFDVVIDEPDPQKALNYARDWLKAIGHEDAATGLENCYFCHSVDASLALREQIDAQGYAIYKLEGCPK